MKMTIKLLGLAQSSFVYHVSSFQLFHVLPCERGQKDSRSELNSRAIWLGSHSTLVPDIMDIVIVPLQRGGEAYLCGDFLFCKNLIRFTFTNVLSLVEIEIIISPPACSRVQFLLSQGVVIGGHPRPLDNMDTTSMPTILCRHYGVVTMSTRSKSFRHIIFRR